ncbi:MAG TPA: ATP-dependent zinc metalloprotease FtsH [Polyangiaceae bacterium]|nr:ATP-dependent zinc metalloprotease FtsH [Polyangiaceae bacterium]
MAKDVRKRQFTFSSVYLLIAVAVMMALRFYVLPHTEPEPMPYSKLLGEIRAGHVAEAEIQSDAIVAKLKEKKNGRDHIVIANRLPGVDAAPLVAELEKQGASFDGHFDKQTWWEQILGWVLPLVILTAFWGIVMRRMTRSAGPMTIGKSQAKIYDLDEEKRVTFADVAGVDEAKAELVEIVDFLKHPDRYKGLGAKIPKGVLLVGPPGTGKTLLARAVAGESGVPFFSLSGSDFVEMFVGVGAARVRDLFAQAVERAPVIIFIDELDAIGRARGGPRAFATNDEREQTLNQLLVQMDGFSADAGIVIMAATNRPEILDKALLRAGRFDRRVLVDAPSLAGREAILGVHTRKVKLAPDVDLKVVARRTPGMVGADLANLVNEAALAAVRRGATATAEVDFDEAIDRQQLGLKKQGRVMTEDEKRRVAYHEGGHALVALSLPGADPVHRVTIIPRSIGALGATLQLPTEERYLMTKQELEDRIAVMLGGRVAEELACGDISTGAQNDLERASELARQMVCRFGMSEALGPLTYGSPSGPSFLEGPVSLTDRNFSEATGQQIDLEVRKIVDAEHVRVRGILGARKPVLEALVERLLAEETLDRDALDAITKTADKRAAE